MAGGRFGVVGDGTGTFSTVENWTVTDTKTADSYVASNTQQGTVRGGGIRTWSGGFNGKGGTPPVMPNDIFTFEGYTAPDTGVEGTDGTVYTGSAICSQVTITWDWAANAIIAWTAEFNGLPGLTFPTGSIPLDASIPPVAPTCPTKIEYGAAIEIPKLTGATLTITAALASEANSSTVSGGDCWTSSSPGPIDWTLAMPQEDYLRGVDGYPSLGDDLELKVYTDATDFWQLKFGRSLDYSNLTVDINTGATISRTYNVAMQASNGTIIGNIIKPGDVPTVTAWWGTPDTP